MGINKMNIEAIISNISFPKTIEELEYFVKEVGQFNVDDVLLYETVEWTVPKWALVGDIVFFFHAKTAIQTICKLEGELKKNKNLNYNINNIVNDLSAEIDGNKMPIKNTDKKVPIKTEQQFNKILQYLSEQSECSCRDICILLHVKERRARQLLQILQEQDKVESYGANKIRRYKLRSKK